MSDIIKATDGMSTNIRVGMDEVVAVFIAQYETNLFNRKNELSTQIKQIKQQMIEHDKRVVQLVDTADYEGTYNNSKLNFTFKVGELNIVWESYHNNVPTITFGISMFRNNDTHRQCYIEERIEIDSKEVELHKQYLSQIETLSTDLMEVINSIKSVSRKERQVRGRLSEMKLKESGYEMLLESPELLALIKLD